MENKEIWKDCKGYEGLYQVSNLGRVWSVRSQRYLCGCPDRDGYISFTLTAKNGKAKRERLRRLVALVFIDNPNNYPVVNHLNGIKSDCRVENLEWTDVKSNTKHAYDNDLGHMKDIQKMITERARKVNMKTYLVYLNDDFIGEFRGAIAAATATSVSEKTVRLCVKEGRKTRTGYSFVIKGGD